MKFKVCVQCITYNHSAFIEDAMNGFCIQDTTFPYVCVIVDDASTDGEVDVIKRYIQENFDEVDSTDSHKMAKDDYGFTFAKHKTNNNCFFVVYYLHSNHFQANKSKDIYFKDWYLSSQYIAWCEGDDYWIDSNKLQRQVSFMDNNDNCSMTCNRTLLYSVKKQKIVGENYCYSHSRKISVKDTIYRTGLFISSCSIVYRRIVTDSRPDYWINCLVGDYPLQIACVLKGNAWFFNEIMSVYRIDNPASWMGSQDWGNGGSNPKRLRIIQSQVKMFDGFGNDYPEYRHLFDNKIAEQINKSVPLRKVSIDKVNMYLANFQEEIGRYNLRWKIDLLCRKSRLPYIRAIYQILFTRSFLVRDKWYK